MVGETTGGTDNRSQELEPITSASARKSDELQNRLQGVSDELKSISQKLSDLKHALINASAPIRDLDKRVNELVKLLGEALEQRDSERCRTLFRQLVEAVKSGKESAVAYKPHLDAIEDTLRVLEIALGQMNDGATSSGTVGSSST